jgi:hypothetical protein
VNYFGDPLHRSLRQFYDHFPEEATVLVFSEAWRVANLPAEMSYNEQMLLTILDTVTGREYPARMPVATEGPHPMWVTDQDWNEPSLCRLQIYFYRHYYGQSRRADDAEIDDEVDPRRRRFLITRIVSPRQPGVILYSETMSVGELEDVLRKADGKRAE